jgi:hypothetical protein
MNTTYNSTNYPENTIDSGHRDIVVIVGIFTFLASVFFCVTRKSAYVDDNSSVNRAKNRLLLKSGKLIITV